MIAVDTNILVYAHRRDSEFHEQAAALVTGVAEGSRPWAIPWPCLHEFFAKVTHPRIYDPPSTTAQAMAQIEAWIESPYLALLGEERGYWPVLRQLVDNAKVRGPLVHDARVAAICLLHNVDELWSADRDFNRFTQLQTRNPLI